MNNIHQFPKQAMNSTQSVDYDYAKWYLQRPENLDAFVSQCIDLLEFEVNFPLKGSGIDKFEAALKQFISNYND